MLKANIPLMYTLTHVVLPKIVHNHFKLTYHQSVCDCLAEPHVGVSEVIAIFRTTLLKYKPLFIEYENLHRV